jgi:hypothetical protein
MDKSLLRVSVIDPVISVCFASAVIVATGGIDRMKLRIKAGRQSQPTRFIVNVPLRRSIISILLSVSYVSLHGPVYLSNSIHAGFSNIGKLVITTLLGDFNQAVEPETTPGSEVKIPHRDRTV